MENTYKFWENIKDYDNEIISVFLEENNLTNKIKKIKNKNKKRIADLGCGSGNSFKYLKEFQEIYAIDFSKNMLELAKKKQKELSINNIIFKEEKIEEYSLKEKVDVSIAISSIMPNSINHFNLMIENIIENTKENGKIIIVLPSFEAKTFFLQLEADLLFNKIKNPQEVLMKIKEKETKFNFNSFGYFITNDSLIQKHWLKEEILFKLKKFNFKKINIDKLELDWTKQVKLNEFKNYPKVWVWLVEIDI